MTENHLPAAIQNFIEATNRGDSDAFVAAFTEDLSTYSSCRSHGSAGATWVTVLRSAGSAEGSCREKP